MEILKDCISHCTLRFKGCKRRYPNHYKTWCQSQNKKSPMTALPDGLSLYRLFDLMNAEQYLEHKNLAYANAGSSVVLQQ
ncbi:MAG: hypothetical protein U5L72_12905 [Bacteroidales bacterium]|nr:hypothetical protein [Bacteroidales bacterium]